MQSITRKVVSRFALLMVLGSSPVAFGQSDDPLGSETPPIPEVEEQWNELDVRFPPYPLEDSLRFLELEYLEPRYDFYLDMKSLSLGADKVLRYTVIIQSKSGTANVLYEGVRCTTREYKTYGFGSNSGKFHPYRSGRWLTLHSVPRQGPLGFRRALASQYLCDQRGSTLDVEGVVGRLGGSDSRTIAGGNPQINDQPQ